MASMFFCGFPLYSCVSHSFPEILTCYPGLQNIPQNCGIRTLIFIPIQVRIPIRFNTYFDADFISILIPISYRFRYRFHTDFVPIPNSYRFHTDTDSYTDLIPISIPIPRFLGHKNTDTEPNSKSHTVS